MLLINCSSVILLKTNGYVGLNSIKFVFSILIITPNTDNKNGFHNTRNIFSTLQFQIKQLGAFISQYLWRYCIAI